MFLWEILDNAARAVADRTALVDGRRRFSFAELADLSNRVGALAAGCTRPGERIAIVSDNSASYVAALYGVPRAGAVLVHGNTRHTVEEIGSLVRRCGATVLLTDRGLTTRLEGLDAPSLRQRLVLDDALDTGGSDHAGTVPTVAGRRDGDLAWLMYTSGTTAAPKGVMLTHRSLLAASLNTTMARPVADDEVYLFPFPLFHVAAYNVVHHHLRHRPVVLLPRFEPESAMAAIEAERVTSVSLAPTMLAMLLDHPERPRHDLSSLRNVSYGAAAMPRELLLRCTTEWPAVGLSQGYGMTELSGNAVFLSPEDHRLAATTRPELLTAAGRPGPMAALRIVAHDGTDADPGQPGEILLRADQVCAGYFEDDDATAAAMGDGWLRTGDVGRIDAEGYLHVVDRVKDIIVTGGENVSSREVEDTLGTHPAVRQVAVVGTPDRRWGELVTAVVVPADPRRPPDLGDLRGTCGAMAGFKHPRRLVLVDELPTNASGKVDKRAVREAVAAGDGP